MSASTADNGHGDESLGSLVEQVEVEETGIQVQKPMKELVKDYVYEEVMEELVIYSVTSKSTELFSVKRPEHVSSAASLTVD